MMDNGFQSNYITGRQLPFLGDFYDSDYVLVLIGVSCTTHCETLMLITHAPYSYTI